MTFNGKLKLKTMGPEKREIVEERARTRSHTQWDLTKVLGGLSEGSATHLEHGRCMFPTLPPLLPSKVPAWHFMGIWGFVWTTAFPRSICILSKRQNSRHLVNWKAIWDSRICLALRSWEEPTSNSSHSKRQSNSASPPSLSLSFRFCWGRNESLALVS